MKRGNIFATDGRFKKFAVLLQAIMFNISGTSKATPLCVPSHAHPAPSWLIPAQATRLLYHFQG